MAKTLYHGALRKLGAVKVTVKSDVLESKYPGKPPYVTLEIGGEDFNYNTENDNCAAFFEGTKGRTFTIVADGGGKDKGDTATITYVGEGVNEGGTSPQTPPKAPQRAAAAPPARRGPAPHNTAAAAPANRQTPANRPPAAPPGKPGLHPQLGQRVGMALNKAVDSLIHEGRPWDPKEIMDRASDLLRISESLESGHLSPKFSERVAGQAQ